MSLSDDFPKPKQDIEREVGIGDKDASKPLLLRLIEQVKFGAPVNSNQMSFERPAPNAEVITFGSNASSNLNSVPDEKNHSPDTSSPDPTSRKENQRKTKKDKAKKSKKDKSKEKGDKDQAPAASSDMTKLADLPSLGGPPGGNRRGFGGFGGFDAADAAEPVEDESNDGFDDFDMNEDAFGDSSNKFDNAEKHLNDFYKEENEGFKISSNKAGGKSKVKQAKKAGFKVNIQGMDRKDSLNDDDFEEEIIEEDI